MAEVVSLHGDGAEQDRRAEFMRIAAETYDAFEKKVGRPPAAMFVMVHDMEAKSSLGWLCLAEAEGQSELLLCKTAILWNREAMA